MVDASDKSDSELLRTVIVAVKGGLSAAALYFDVKVSNAIIRLLDALGLDGHWFSFGPYRGWYVVGSGKHFWTVLEWDPATKAYVLANTGATFLDALELLVDGKTDELLRLWVTMSKVEVE